MKRLLAHVRTTYPQHKISFQEAKYPILEMCNFLTLSLFVVGLGCDILPGGIPGITPNIIWKEIHKMKKEN